MNNDLISREALLEEIRERMLDKDEVRDDLDKEYNKGLMHAIKDVKRAPAVDVVEVVRCSECKHSAFDAYSNRRMCIRNGEIRPNGRIWFGTAVNDDHFCGYGVKMDADPPKSVT